MFKARTPERRTEQDFDDASRGSERPERPESDSSTRQRTPRERFLVACLLFVVLAGLYGPRPFLLGFCSDDWQELVFVPQQHGRFSWELLHEAFAQSGIRPGYVAARWLFDSVLGPSPALWHIALAGSTVLIAWLAAKLASALNALGGGRDRIASAPVMFAFLLAPWAFGFTAWPIMLSHLPALMLFLVSAILAVRGLTNERVCWWAFPCFTLSCMFYECCYLQFLPLLAICSVLLLSAKQPRRPILIRLGLVLFGFTVAQAAAVLLKAWFAHSMMGARTFYPNFLHLAAGQILHLPHTLLQGTFGARGWTFYSFLGLALLFPFTFVDRCRLRRDGRLSYSLNVHALLLASSCVLALLSGVVISVLLYAMASYLMSGTGVMSRTTIMTTLWFSLLVGVLAGKFGSTASVPLDRLRRLALFSLMAGLGLASAGRIHDWSRAWEMQKEVLSAAPFEQIAATDPNAMIVALVPQQFHSVSVFECPWDLSAALGATYPATKCGAARCSSQGPQRGVYPHGSRRRTVWDGRMLIQSTTDGQKLWETQTTEVWIWDYHNGQFYQASAGLAIE